MPKVTADCGCSSMARSAVVSTTCTVGPDGTIGLVECPPEHEKQQQNKIENRAEVTKIRGKKTECMINSTIVWCQRRLLRLAILVASA